MIDQYQSFEEFSCLNSWIGWKIKINFAVVNLCFTEFNQMLPFHFLLNLSLALCMFSVNLCLANLTHVSSKE